MSRFKGGSLGDVFVHAIEQDQFFEHDMVEELMRLELPQ